MLFKNTLLGVLQCLGLIAASLLLCFGEACTNKSFEARCLSCVDSLVETWRTHPKADCSAQYLAHKRCISRHKDKCLGSPGLTNYTASIIQQRSRVYTANEKFFCEDGIFDSLKYRSHAVNGMCSKRLLTRAGKCRTRFLKKVLRNSGSKKLCSRYYKAKQCMLKAIRKHCKPQASAYLMRKYQKPYNPYCKDKSDSGKTAPQRTPGFGRCTRKGYLTQSRECTKNFIQSLQRNNGKQCRSLVRSSLLPCTKTRLRRCLRGGPRDDKTLDKDIEKSFDSRQINHLQNVYCEGGFLSTVRLRAEQCPAEYFETFQGKCSSKFRAEYRQNRGNPKLCQYYAEVKQCARNMTLSMCTLTDELKNEVFFLYGEFNPFCRDGKDPVIHSRRAIHDKRKTTLDSGSIAHAWSVITLVIGVFAATSIGCYATSCDC